MATCGCSLSRPPTLSLPHTLRALLEDGGKVSQTTTALNNHFVRFSLLWVLVFCRLVLLPTLGQATAERGALPGVMEAATSPCDDLDDTAGQRPDSTKTATHNAPTYKAPTNKKLTNKTINNNTITIKTPTNNKPPKRELLKIHPITQYPITKHQIKQTHQQDTHQQ